MKQSVKISDISNAVAELFLDYDMSEGMDGLVVLHYLAEKIGSYAGVDASRLLGEHAAPTIEAMEAVAVEAHEENYAASGDRYATAEEMDMLRDDPLACSEMVIDQLVVRTGFGLRGRKAVIAWPHERANAQASLDDTRAWRAARAEVDAASAA